MRHLLLEESLVFSSFFFFVICTNNKEVTFILTIRTRVLGVVQGIALWKETSFEMRILKINPSKNSLAIQ